MLKKNNIGSLLCLFALSWFYVQTAGDVLSEKRFFDAEWSNLRNDAGIYYAYLPATFIKKNPLFTFLDVEPGVVPEKGIQYWAAQSEKGGWVPKMTMGKAFMDLPFFFLADAYVQCYKHHDRTGFSLPYQNAMVYATLFYTVFGFFFLRLVLLRFFEDFVVALTIIILALATNLFHYACYETAYTHPHNFFILSVLIYLATRWEQKGTIWQGAIFGLLCGLLVLVRPINFLLLLPLPLFSVYFQQFAFSFSALKSGVLSFFKTRKFLFGFGVAVLVLFPQLLFWKIQSGSWLYYSYQDEGFFWTNPQILEGLFSFRKGWLLYTPVMFLACIGLFQLLFRKQSVALRWIGASLVVTLIIFIYVTFSWWCWWYGGGFGARTMIDFYPYMAFGLAGILAGILKKGFLIKAISAVVILFVIKLNTFQTHQYHLSLIHWDSMTYEAYKSVFFKEQFPDNFQELLSEPDYQKQKETGEE